jgi:hypothetical protein
MAGRLVMSAGMAFGPLLLAYVMLACLYPALAGSILLFLLFVILWVLIPGYALAEFLLDRNLGPIDKAVLGGIAAMACLTLLGLIGARLGFQSLVFTQLGLTAVGITKIVRGRIRLASGTVGHRRLDLVFAATFTLVAIFVFAQFLIPAAPPTPAVPGLFYQDSLWTVGNTKAILKWGLPMRDLRLEGFARSYHVAQNLFQIAVVRFSGADPFDVHFYLEPLWDWFLITFAIVRAPSILNNFSVLESGLLASFVLFGAGIDGSRPGGKFWDPLSFGFGLPSVIVVHLVLLAFLRGERLRPGYVALLVFLATAAKSTVIFYVFFSLGTVVAWQWLRRRVRPPREVLVLFGLVVPLAAIWKWTALSIAGTGLLQLAPVDPLSVGYRLIYQNRSLGSLAAPLFELYRFTKPFTINLPRFALYWPPALLVIWASWCLRRERGVKVEYPTLYVAVFTVSSIGTEGIVAAFGGGHYFFVYPELLTTLLAVMLIHDAGAKLRRNLLIGSAIAVAVCTAMFGRSVVQHAQVWGQWPSPGRVLWDPRASIRHDEWVACQWLRQRAHPDSVFFSNRRSFLHELRREPVNRFFGYSTLTGLKAFVEGEGFVPPNMIRQAEANWARVNRFLDGRDSMERAGVLSEIRADYFIEDRHVSQGDYRTTPGLSLIYDTAGVRIFEKTPASRNEANAGH